PLNFNPITSYVNISDQPSAVLLHSLTAQDGFAPYQYVIDSVLPASFAANIDLNQAGELRTNSALASGAVLTVKSRASDTLWAGDSNTAEHFLIVSVHTALAWNPPEAITVGATATADYPLPAASGGSGDYLYALSQQPQPANVVNLSDSGVISFVAPLGYASAVTLSVRLADTLYSGDGFAVDAEIVITTSPPLVLDGIDSESTITLRPVKLRDEDQAIATLTVTGGVAPYTYSLLGLGDEQAGQLVIDSNGVINDNGFLASGVPDAITTSIRIIDSVDNRITPVYEIQAIDAVSVLATHTLTVQESSIGAVYTVAAAAGAGLYQYTIVSTNPPALTTLLQLDNVAPAARATLSVIGNGLSAGIASIHIRAADSYSDATLQLVIETSLQIRFAPPAISVYINRQETGNIYTVQASAGLPPYVYAEKAGSSNNTLPYNVSADGVISLSAAITTSNTISIYIEASDQFGTTAELTVDLIAVAGVQFVEKARTVTLLVGNNSGVVYNAATDSAFGSVSYTIVSSAPTESLSNLSIAANGELHLQNNVTTPQEIEVVLKATDDVREDLATVLLDINNAVGFAADNITVSVHLSDQAAVITSAIGGGGDYTYSQVSANISNYVALSFVANNIVASVNSAAQLGLLTVVVAATDVLPGSATLTINLEIIPDVELLVTTYTIAASASGKVGTLVASGGDGNYTYRAQDNAGNGNNTPPVNEGEGGSIGNNAPAIVSIFADGVVSITATLGYGVTLSLTVQASDSIGGVGGHSEALLSIVAPLKLNFPSATISVVAVLPDDNNGVLATIRVSNGSGNYQYDLESVLPNELQLGAAFVIDATTGILSDNGGLSGFTVGDVKPKPTLQIAASDSFGNGATVFVELSFATPVELANGGSITLLVDDSSGAVLTLAASGGVGDYNYTIINTNPVVDNLRYQNVGGEGVLTLTSAMTQVQTITAFVRADDGNSSADSQIIIIVVPTVLISPLTLTSPFNSTEVIGSIVVSGGKAPYVYSLVATTPAEEVANISVFANGAVSVKVGKSAFADVNLEVAVEDGFGKQTTATILVRFQESLTSDNLFGLGNIMIIGGNAGLNGDARNVWVSNDSALTSWVEAYTNTNFVTGRAAASFNGSVYLVGGTNGGGVGYSDIVYASPNSSLGTTWVSVGITPEAVHEQELVVLGQQLLMFGGQDASKAAVTEVWRSTDGANWQLATNNYPGEVYVKAAVFNDILYVTGSGTELWSTSDGTNWTASTTPMPVDSSFNSRVAVFDNTFYLLDRNVIYYSSDMVSWSDYPLSDAIGLRDGAGFLAYEDRLVLFGGGINDGGNERNDIWVNTNPTDGTSWTQAEDSADWVERKDFVALVIDDEPLVAQVPPFAANLQQTQFTIIAGVATEVASLAVSGGYLAGGDYEIIISGDEDDFSIVDDVITFTNTANLNDNTTLTLNLTLEVNDQFAANAAQTLSLALEIIQQEDLSLENSVYVQLPSTNTGQEIYRAETTGGSGNYNYSLGNVTPALLSNAIALDNSNGIISAASPLNTTLVGQIEIIASDVVLVDLVITATIDVFVIDKLHVEVIPYWQDVEVGASRIVAEVSVVGFGAHTVSVISSASQLSFDKTNNQIVVNNAVAGLMEISLAFADADGSPADLLATVVYQLSAYSNNTPVTGESGFYLAGDKVDGKLWRSRDNGATWENIATNRDALARSGFEMVSWNNKLWILGGSDGFGDNNGSKSYGDVWSYSEGGSWVLEAENAFPPRNHHGAVVYDNKLWVVGGRSNADSIYNNTTANTYADVWSSTNGRDWVLVSEGQFSGVYGHGLFLYDHQLGNGIELVVYGGIVTNANAAYNSAGVSNQNWHSKDGVNWTSLLPALPNTVAATALTHPGIQFVADEDSNVLAFGAPFAATDNSCYHIDANGGGVWASDCSGTLPVNSVFPRLLRHEDNYYALFGYTAAPGQARVANNTIGNITQRSTIAYTPADLGNRLAFA
ncbi:MAG: hypothetical protein K0U15_04225, partial [Proteobacteria bacterium]|nr:hypothetical protein [Pseudomonadota bacterium]